MDDFLSLMDGGSKAASRKRKRSRKSFSGCNGVSGIKGGKSNMTKADITKYAAEKCGISQQKAKCVIDATFEFIREMGADKDACITISGFGTFRPKTYRYNSKIKSIGSGVAQRLTFKASK
jgi:nucleoid DNA-binding protein